MRLPEEKIEVICIEEWDLEYIQEEVEGLAEDVCDLDDKVDSTLDVLKWVCDNWLEMCNVMRMLDEKINEVERLRREWENLLWFILAIVFVVTFLLVLHAFNVF